jgi:hypothetical protein
MSELSSYSPERPLILVTDYSPDVGGGGAVILRSLLGAADRGRILWLSPSLAPGTNQPDRIALAQGSHGLAPWLKRRSVTVDSVLAGRLASEIATIASQRNAAGLWLVMHGAIVHAAARLLDRIPLPVHLSVHDDPPFGVALMSRRHLALIPLIARDLGRALRRARSIDVISEAMADYYRGLYGVGSVVVHRGMDRTVAPSPPHDTAGGLEIGVLGNTYGYEQLVILADAVKGAADQLGVPGRIVVVGQGHGARLKELVSGRLEVELAGHLAEEQAVERLRRCFLLYLNYPFSRRASVLRRTSFPTKLSTYTLAARPLLAHAPPDSSISPLARFTGYAVRWENERIADGVAAIVQAWKTQSMHESRHHEAEEVRSTYYDLEANRRALFGTLNRLVQPA